MKGDTQLGYLEEQCANLWDVDKPEDAVFGILGILEDLIHVLRDED